MIYIMESKIGTMRKLLSQVKKTNSHTNFRGLIDSEMNSSNHSSVAPGYQADSMHKSSNLCLIDETKTVKAHYC